MSVKSRPLVIGHRGAPGYRPEHSPSAYLLAVEQGADAVEPDLVLSRDGVLIVRHENDISETTDIADRPEFAHLRRTKTVDGVEHDGWFTEDLDAAQLRTLRCRERLPTLRPLSAGHDDAEHVLTLAELLALLDGAARRRGRPVTVVAEIKHATYFAGLGFDMAALFLAQIGERGPGGLVVESFERGILRELAAAGIAAPLVYLLENTGIAADDFAREGAAGPTYEEALTEEGLAALATEFQGISVAISLILAPGGPELVARAQRHGLTVYTWTQRPENAFLAARFRGGAGGEGAGDRAAHGRGAEQIRALRDAGVDGIFADHPDLALRALEL